MNPFAPELRFHPAGPGATVQAIEGLFRQGHYATVAAMGDSFREWTEGDDTVKLALRRRYQLGGDDSIWKRARFLAGKLPRSIPWHMWRAPGVTCVELLQHAADVGGPPTGGALRLAMPSGVAFVDISGPFLASVWLGLPAALEAGFAKVTEGSVHPPAPATVLPKSAEVLAELERAPF